MSRTLLSALFLSACSPGSIKLGDDTAVESSDDTAVDADDTAADTDDTDDTAVDTDTEPVMVPDYTVWNATRRFFYESEYADYSCDETVTETGSAIPEGTSDYDALHDLCGICDWFYEVEPDRDSACDGYLELGTGWRGVSLAEGDAAVYFYREVDGGLEEYAADESATFDGTTITYGYEFEYYTSYILIDVTGAITYPLIEQE